MHMKKYWSMFQKIMKNPKRKYKKNWSIIFCRFKDKCLSRVLFAYWNQLVFFVCNAKCLVTTFSEWQGVQMINAMGLDCANLCLVHAMGQNCPHKHIILVIVDIDNYSFLTVILGIAQNEMLEIVDL